MYVDDTYWMISLDDDITSYHLMLHTGSTNLRISCVFCLKMIISVLLLSPKHPKIKAISITMITVQIFLPKCFKDNPLKNISWLFQHSCNFFISFCVSHTWIFVGCFSKSSLRTISTCSHKPHHVTCTVLIVQNPVGKGEGIGGGGRGYFAWTGLELCVCKIIIESNQSINYTLTSL